MSPLIDEESIMKALVKIAGLASVFICSTAFAFNEPKHIGSYADLRRLSTSGSSIDIKFTPHNCKATHSSEGTNVLAVEPEYDVRVYTYSVHRTVVAINQNTSTEFLDLVGASENLGTVKGNDTYLHSVLLQIRVSVHPNSEIDVEVAVQNNPSAFNTYTCQMNTGVDFYQSH